MEGIHGSGAGEFGLARRKYKKETGHEKAPID
jgi:hypothetical protein